MPTTRPDTHFVDGICSACLSYERRSEIDWDARKAELLALLDRHDGRCIVPSSGGKDSHYQVLTLLELGAKPLVVTASTCMLTEIGRRNIDNLARYATTVEVTPKREVRAKLNRLGLKMVGDISHPEHMAIFSIPFRVAVQTGVPLLMYGECPQREYGGPPGAEEARQMTRRWVAEYGGMNGLRATDFVGIDGITERDMQDYALPTDEAIASAGVEAHFLGQYIGPWDGRANATKAHAAGMVWTNPTPANWWSFENQDSGLTGVHDFFCYLKFGYGRGAAQISVDIRAGRISRDDALQWLREFDGLFPLRYLGYPLECLLSDLKVKQDDFIESCNRFMNRELFVEPGVEYGMCLTLKEFA